MEKKYFILLLFFFASLSQSQVQYPPISPKWVFEPWVWEDRRNTEESTLDVLKGYTDNGIPYGNTNIDSPWEWPSWPSGNTSEHGNNTFVFERKRYPNPREFIKELHDRRLHVTVWITGVMTTDCPKYDSIKALNYFVNSGATTAFWRGSGAASHIDFFNPEALAYWRSLMDKVLDDSIRCRWMENG